MAKKTISQLNSGTITDNDYLVFESTAQQTLKTTRANLLTGYVKTVDITGVYAPISKGVDNGNFHDHIGGDGSPITEGAISLSDNTTNNVSISRHGFTPKAPNDINKVLLGNGSWGYIFLDWIPVTETWTRTGNHTFTVVGDLTAKYRKGTKVRYKDGGSYKYGVIGSSLYSAPNTTVTLITNSNYTMAATTITDTAISYVENPEGFPEYFNYTATLTGFSSIFTNFTVWNTKGNIIYIGFSYSGTSNSSSFVATLPVNIADSSLRFAFNLRGRNNGTYDWRLCVIGDGGDGKMTFYSSATGGTWTSSGTKSMDRSWVSYIF